MVSFANPEPSYWRRMLTDGMRKPLQPSINWNMWWLNLQSWRCQTWLNSSLSRQMLATEEWGQSSCKQATQSHSLVNHLGFNNKHFPPMKGNYLLFYWQLLNGDITYGANILLYVLIILVSNICWNRRWLAHHNMCGSPNSLGLTMRLSSKKGRTMWLLMPFQGCHVELSVPWQSLLILLYS